mgnify:CR=1 FL=1
MIDTCHYLYNKKGYLEGGAINHSGPALYDSKAMIDSYYWCISVRDSDLYGDYDWLTGQEVDIIHHHLHLQHHRCCHIHGWLVRYNTHRKVIMHTDTYNHFFFIFIDKYIYKLSLLDIKMIEV